MRTLIFLVALLPTLAHASGSWPPALYSPWLKRQCRAPAPDQLDPCARGNTAALQMRLSLLQKLVDRAPPDDPQRPELLYSHAILLGDLARVGDPDVTQTAEYAHASISHLRALLKRHPQYRSADFATRTLGISLYEFVGDAAAAEGVLLSLARKSRFSAAETLTTLAGIYLDQGDWNRARSTYRDFIRRYPKHRLRHQAWLRIQLCEAQLGV